MQEEDLIERLEAVGRAVVAACELIELHSLDGEVSHLLTARGLLVRSLLHLTAGLDELEELLERGDSDVGQGGA